MQQHEVSRAQADILVHAYYPASVARSFDIDDPLSRRVIFLHFRLMAQIKEEHDSIMEIAADPAVKSNLERV